MTVTKLSIGVDNWLDVDGAVISASSAVSSAPVSRIGAGNTVVMDRWRTDFATTVWFQVDWLVNRNVDVLAFAQPWDSAMIAATDTVHHRLDVDGGVAGTGAAYGSTAIASGVVGPTRAGETDGYGLHVHLPPATVSARYWRCDIVATSLATSPRYVDIGRAWAGPLVEFSRNAGFGYVDRPVDPSTVTTAKRSRAQYVDVVQSSRMFSFALSVLSDTDGRHTLKALQRLIGVRRQILFIPNPQGSDVPTEAMFCRDSRNDGQRRDTSLTWSSAFDLVETK